MVFCLVCGKPEESFWFWRIWVISGTYTNRRGGYSMCKYWCCRAPHSQTVWTLQTSGPTRYCAISDPHMVCISLLVLRLDLRAVWLFFLCDCVITAPRWTLVSMTWFLNNYLLQINKIFYYDTKNNNISPSIKNYIYTIIKNTQHTIVTRIFTAE